MLARSDNPALRYKGFTGRSFVGFFRMVGAFSDDFPALIGDFSALVDIDGLLVFIPTTPDAQNT